MDPVSVFEFNKDAEVSQWQVVSDTVMGGRSSGDFSFSESGHGIFSGSVSLENNGGFSMLKYPFQSIQIPNATKIRLELKGDGKLYQVRIRHRTSDRHVYAQAFQTSGNKETLEMVLSEMVPVFRGKKLDIPNFHHAEICELQFLIGNKKAESFCLELNSIYLM